jgi:serine O-acetyltransferase
MRNDEPFLKPAVSSSRPSWGLDQIVVALRRSREEIHNIRYRGRIRELPSRDALLAILNGLSATLFPTHYGQPDLTDDSIDYFVGNTLNTTLNSLAEQVRRALLFAADQDDAENPDPAISGENDHRLRLKAMAITGDFAAQLPEIRDLLVSDLQAAYQGDPAATSVSEILLCYPGMTAIIYHRFAHALYRLGVPFLARLISRIAHSNTGIDIHPGADIGSSFFIDHGSGVVIGETSVIGRHVRLYQAVTLGAKRFPVDEEGILIKGNARHPIVEDDVVIYAGATILGRITIGKGSTIGGNIWLTQSVPPGSNVTQAQMRNS